MRKLTFLPLFLAFAFSACNRESGGAQLKDEPVPDRVDVERQWASEVKQDLLQAQRRADTLRDSRASLSDARDFTTRRRQLIEQLNTITAISVDLQNVVERMIAKLAAPNVPTSIRNVANVSGDEFANELNNLRDLASANGKLDKLKQKSAEYALAVAAGDDSRTQLRADILALLSQVSDDIAAVTRVIDDWINQANGIGSGGSVGTGGSGGRPRPRTSLVRSRTFRCAPDDGDFPGNATWLQAVVEMVAGDVTNHRTVRFPTPAACNTSLQQLNTSPQCRNGGDCRIRVCIPNDLTFDSMDTTRSHVSFDEYGETRVQALDFFPRYADCIRQNQQR